MHDLARREVIDPELDKLEREIKNVNRSSGGFLGIEARVERDEPVPAPALEKTDEMRRVDFACHRAESVKAIDEVGPVRALPSLRPGDVVLALRSGSSVPIAFIAFLPLVLNCRRMGAV